MHVDTVFRAERTKMLIGVIVALLVTSALLSAPAAATRTAAASSCPDPSGSVKVGLSYFGGVEQSLGDIGASDAAELSPASRATIAGYKAGIDALNEAGGLGGCHVEPAIFNFSAASADFNQTSQQECAAFTQDNKVVAVFTTAYETKAAVDCYAKAKTPMFVFGGSYLPTCGDMKKYAGYVYLPAGIATCNFGAFIGLWNKAGLFPKDAKVGILVFDDGSGQGQHLADKVWTPALKKLKIPVQTFSYPASTSVSNFATTSSALASAILKFKADGVNVVLFTPSASQGVAAFLPQAGQQGYYPSYGLQTGEIGIAGSFAGAPGAELIKKAVGVSWNIIDIPLTAQQALAPNPAIEACAEWSAPSTTTLTGSSFYCDFLSILKAGFENATKVDAASLKKGIEALDSSFASSVTYGGATRFAKNHYDGASTVEVLTWDTTSKTFGFESSDQSAVAVSGPAPAN